MKKILSTVLLAVCLNISFAQSYMGGIGLFGGHSTDINGYSFAEFGFTYSPRFNFLEKDKFSVSAGIPLGVGFAMGTSSLVYDSYNSTYTSGTAAGVILDVPVMVNINFGRGSTKSNTDKFGFFGGIGLGLNEQLLVDDSPTNSTASSANIGPAINGGVRFGIGKRGHKNLEVKLYGMDGISGAKTVEITGAAIFNF